MLRSRINKAPFHRLDCGAAGMKVRCVRPVTLRRTHATPFSLLHLLLLLLLFYSCDWKLGGECEHTQIQKALYIVQYMIRSYQHQGTISQGQVYGDH